VKQTSALLADFVILSYGHFGGSWAARNWSEPRRCSTALPSISPGVTRRI